ncbi:MAG: DUF6516 family protein [Ardenticatenaceae bacterium]|nr:DUF6516 family protein [Ardenticatenaceae bacterium]HBY96400.1 hypothetical protein [Chloroflexota bacterium]
MIQAYFSQIKATVDQCATTRFVLDANVSFETRPGGQGYLTGSITFTDGSALHFSEFLDAAKGTADKLMYTYHYQDAGHQLIFRYDNARHRPPLSSLEHKHAPTQVVEAPAPRLEDVLDEIVVTNGWMQENATKP